VPDRRADGTVAGFFLMVLDITDRHRAELALARSEALVRAITDQMPGLISRMDRDYRYTFANAHYERWFSLAESPVGKTVAEVFGERCSRACARASTRRWPAATSGSTSPTP
jgi:PAS domain-containing protein